MRIAIFSSLFADVALDACAHCCCYSIASYIFWTLSIFPCTACNWCSSP